MKIEASSIYWTPESPKALKEYIERLSGSEKALAYVIAGMTWNLCAKLTNDEKDTDS